MLAAVDDRLACAAVACGNTENFACRDFIALARWTTRNRISRRGPPGTTVGTHSTPWRPNPWHFVQCAGLFHLGQLSHQRPGRVRTARAHLFHAGPYRPASMGGIALPHSLSEPLRIEIYQWLRAG